MRIRLPADSAENLTAITIDDHHVFMGAKHATARLGNAARRRSYPFAAFVRRAWRTARIAD